MTTRLHNKRREEAGRDAARDRALAFVGPPRPKARGTYDEEGLLITYTGCLCKMCSVQLTNRNRMGRQLLCRPCYRIKDRARVRHRGPRRPRNPDAELKALLRQVIPPPVHVSHFDPDYELKHLLLRAIPEAVFSADLEAPLLGLQGLPVADPGEDLPAHHYTTKAEFLADAASLGVR